MNDGSLLPIFPLEEVVFFPRVLLPLNIFENRYKKLISDVVKLPEQNRLIAISNMTNKDLPLGYNPFSSIATVGKVVYIEKMDNGMSKVILHGQFTVEIEEIRPVQTPYRICKIKEIREEYWKNPVGSQETEKNRLLEAIDEFASRTKIKIDNISEIALDDLINGLSFSLNIPSIDKQELLEEPNLDSRLDNLIHIISQIGYYRGFKPQQRDYTKIN